MGTQHYLDEIDFAILTQTYQSLVVSLPAELVSELNEAVSEKINTLMNHINSEIQRLKN